MSTRKGCSSTIGQKIWNEVYGELLANGISNWPEISEDLEERIIEAIELVLWRNNE